MAMRPLPRLEPAQSCRAILGQFKFSEALNGIHEHFVSMGKTATVLTAITMITAGYKSPVTDAVQDLYSFHAITMISSKKTSTIVFTLRSTQPWSCQALGTSSPEPHRSSRLLAKPLQLQRDDHGTIQSVPACLIADLHVIEAASPPIVVLAKQC